MWTPTLRALCALAAPRGGCAALGRPGGGAAILLGFGVFFWSLGRSAGGWGFFFRLRGSFVRFGYTLRLYGFVPRVGFAYEEFRMLARLWGAPDSGHAAVAIVIFRDRRDF
ncbi:hypothetical protein J2732_005109 [Achromobacter deleyi]|uniref:hypothetical protein n=1 Tax=Achromobacter deleyi TaxID=1353891 RepID=UPI002858567A|nr:hypothetical protein [Achromobacter deleyi]MDR6604082.1 hypothetical protein [Achromobacter deleyi]